MPKDFLQQVSQYNDGELLKRFEKPYELESEEYAAVLMVLFEREIITKSEFDDYFAGIEKSDGSIIIVEEPVYTLEDNEINVNTDEFWKCPECGEVIELKFDTCWKCMCARPQKIAHPNFEEVSKFVDEKKPVNITFTGLTVFILSAIICTISYFLDDSDAYVRYDYHIGRYVFLSVAFIIGIILFFIGIHKKGED
jgi:hypothetical protein